MYYILNRYINIISRYISIYCVTFFVPTGKNKLLDKVKTFCVFLFNRFRFYVVVVVVFFLIGGKLF